MHRFTQVDVFSDTLLLGNPVAVVHDADDLSSEQMAALANWTNLSETTFLLTPTVPDADYRLRIFTPQRELPFAGHPTLGSARAWLESGGVARQAEVVQECAAGLISIGSRPIGSLDGLLAFAAPPLVRTGAVELEVVQQIATFLRVPVEAIQAAQWVDNGPGWVAVLLSNAASVLAVQPAPEGPGHLMIGVVGAFPPGEEVDFEVRAFAADLAGGEDPVTGSLNASLAQWLIGAGIAPTSYTVAQGTRLGRRGRVHIDQRGGDIWVGGHTVVGVSGTISL